MCSSDLARKNRILLHWSEPAALSAVAIPAAGTVGLAVVFFDGYTSALAILAVLLAALYSLPPVRLKERGIFGWIGAVATQRTLPVVIGIQAF